MEISDSAKHTDRLLFVIAHDGVLSSIHYVDVKNHPKRLGDYLLHYKAVVVYELGDLFEVYMSCANVDVLTVRDVKYNKLPRRLQELVTASLGFGNPDDVLYIGLPEEAMSSKLMLAGINFETNSLQRIIIDEIIAGHYLTAGDIKGVFGVTSFVAKEYSSTAYPDYSQQNNGWTIGCEVELNRRLPVESFLIKLGFVPTSDATCAIEYKSPIFDYPSPKVDEFLKTLAENFKPKDIMSMHLHVGHRNKSFANLIRRGINSRGSTVTSMFCSYPIENIYGRKPNNYCNKAARIGHHHALQETSEGLLEFRLPTFISEEQYRHSIELSLLVMQMFMTCGLPRNGNDVLWWQHLNKHFEEVWNTHYASLNYLME